MNFGKPYERELKPTICLPLVEYFTIHLKRINFRVYGFYLPEFLFMKCIIFGRIIQLYAIRYSVTSMQHNSQTLLLRSVVGWCCTEYVRTIMLVFVPLEQIGALECLSSNRVVLKENLILGSGVITF